MDRSSLVHLLDLSELPVARCITCICSRCGCHCWMLTLRMAALLGHAARDLCMLNAQHRIGHAPTEQRLTACELMILTTRFVCYLTALGASTKTGTSSQQPLRPFGGGMTPQDEVGSVCWMCCTWSGIKPVSQTSLARESKHEHRCICSQLHCRQCSAVTRFSNAGRLWPQGLVMWGSLHRSIVL